MTVTMTGLNLGRHVFGMAILATGLCTLVWHNDSHQLAYVVFAAAVAQIIGGATIQFRWTENMGAAVLSGAYLVLCLLCPPGIAAQPKVYNSWGNFFEQFSMFTGAAVVSARLAPAWPRDTVQRIGRIFFGMCSASFALEQAVYLASTASLVPRWLPPGQMFWAGATTILFALAALALLTNQLALLAARLLTMMLVIFGVLVWVPLVVSNVHSHGNWSECAETFAIAGAAWIIADLLGEQRPTDQRPR